MGYWSSISNQIRKHFHRKGNSMDKEQLKNTSKTVGRHIDKDKIEKAIVMILEAIGEDPKRDGLIETPKRVSKYYSEIFEGMLYSNEDIAMMFNKTFEHKDVSGLVVEKDITVFSMCEHHLALMYDMKVAIGYIPNGKVIGLSKLNRIAQMVAKRPQLQEKIGEDICDVLERVLGTKDIAVYISGKHGCVASRGIKDPNSVTVTATLRGTFRKNAMLRSEFYSMIK